MPTITLPDGNNIDFSNKVTGLEVAEKISKSLAKQALVMSVDGELKDLYYEINKEKSVVGKRELKKIWTTRPGILSNAWLQQGRETYRPYLPMAAGVRKENIGGKKSKK